ncbi:PR-1-like protein [Xylariaceae sp. AK1471]|nr:PR-1-like protein [Xylariaceae sp. AK1471]
MKSSIFVAATSAVLALANPLDRRVLETEVVVEYYTVTVTGNPPAATPTHVKARPHYTKPAQQQPPVEQPKPTTPSQPIVVVTVTPEQQQQAQPTSVVQDPAPEPSTVAAPAEASGSPAISDSQFQDQAVFHHNIHRSNHSSPEIVWNQTIADWADNTAKTCHFAHDMTQGSGHYGQNIALWGVSSGAAELGFTGAIKAAITNMWYDGEFGSFLPSYYGQPTPDMGNFEAWGHMSQVVWAASTSVGCSSVFCPKGTAYDDLDSWYSVCNYYPLGNLGGAYADNIHPPKGDKIAVA